MIRLSGKTLIRQSELIRRLGKGRAVTLELGQLMWVFTVEIQNDLNRCGFISHVVGFMRAAPFDVFTTCAEANSQVVLVYKS